MTNVTVIAGKLGKDCELRKTQAGKDIMSFSLAVSEGKDRTTWFDCATSAPYLMNIQQYLVKGASVTCVGKMAFNNVQDGKGYWPTLWVDNITLQGSKSDAKPKEPAYEEDPMNADIPFAWLMPLAGVGISLLMSGVV